MICLAYIKRKSRYQLPYHQQSSLPHYLLMNECFVTNHTHNTTILRRGKFSMTAILHDYSPVICNLILQLLKAT